MGSRNRSVIAACAALIALAVVVPSADAAGATTFTFTASEQSYTVPTGVTSVSVVAIGAPGGAGPTTGGTQGGTGGRGAVAAGTIAVQPGETLYVEVGGGGGSGDSGGGGGFNGGGNGFHGAPGTPGGGGGGASDVRKCSISAVACTGSADTLHSRLIVAAGGGGGGVGYGSASGGSGGEAGIVNGNDGQAGDTTGLVGGGGAGATLAGGGSGGSSPNPALCSDGPHPGTDGGLGAGGAGGSTDANANSGGGGGGGYFGGGGGGSACTGIAIPMAAPGGGGGAGSSDSPAGGSSGLASTSTPSVRIAPLPAPALNVAPSNLGYASQPIGTTSAPKLVTLTNSGAGPLTITGVDFIGTDPGDYYVSASTCTSPVASGASCAVSVRFAPLVQGARSATLRIMSNDPASPVLAPVSGTGGAALQGPRGPAGNTGPAGKAQLVSCKTVTRTVTRVIRHKRRRVKVTQQQCSARLVSGPVKVKTTAADASLSRRRVLYARGYETASSHGHSRLVLTDVRHRLRPGRYTLTVRRRHGHRWSTHRTTITIG